MKQVFVITAFVFSGLFMACTKTPPNPYTDNPQIYYNGISTDHVNFFDSGVVCNIKFGFSDGNGDLGEKENDSNIVMIDMRSDTVFQAFHYTFPYIDKDARKNKWLEGKVDILLQGVYFMPRTDLAHTFVDPVTGQIIGRDTLSYIIYITDEAGNISNTIQTPPIYIQN